ncbi:MAG: alpha-ketoacid dehydrogenase subunit beta [Gammaproteobacteria bacterium]|nr:alpha-ketoacid dehydrogenase subunit beta [Gammaproteobacteria bacterium]
MAELTMVEAIRNTLKAEMERDERIIVMGEDVGQLGGVFRATDGLRQFFGPNRVIDTPLAESVIAGSALGLAYSGLIPVIEIQFLGFSQNAFHQICQQIARTRFRTRGSQPAQITIRAPFGGNVRTPELHSDSMEAQYAQGTGLKVVMPSTAYDAKGLLAEAIRDPDPVLFLEPLRGYRLVSDEVPDEDYTVPFGKLRTIREGTDITLVTWSASVPVVEEAAEKLAAEGISAHVIDLRTLVPLDEAGLIEAVERTGRCVVVHESPAAAGFGAEVITLLQEQAFYSLEAPLRRVTAPDSPYPPPAIEGHYVPTSELVVRAVKETLVD